MNRNKSPKKKWSTIFGIITFCVPVCAILFGLIYGYITDSACSSKSYSRNAVVDKIYYKRPFVKTLRKARLVAADDGEIIGNVESEDLEKGEHLTVWICGSGNDRLISIDNVSFSGQQELTPLD